MRNAIVGFFLGFVLAQGGWWLAAREAAGAGEDGGAAMRFLLLDTVEVLVACALFALTMTFVARGARVGGATKALVLAIVAGATTSTLTAPPSSLVPRLLPGDAQFILDIAAAAVVSAAFGWLMARAFCERDKAAPEAQPATTH